ncbi:MAG: YbhB/YbcL family Raf kinase inhibitor-like protein [Magnetococcales bacterium]|nr:YbhB/YbcL family Raf kinase inhibitor-like protein [Magnetococcales bacterium]
MKRHTMAWIVSLMACGMASGAGAMELTSPDLKSGGAFEQKFIFKGFGCDGGNVSPALSWEGAPAETKSFALLVHDPDAPTGGAGWWHWVVYDIPATVKALPQGAGQGDGAAMVPGAKQGITDFGAPGWGGPCPPVGHGIHPYHFTLHALKVEKLEVPQGASASLVGYMVNSHSLAHARLTGHYGR